MHPIKSVSGVIGIGEGAKRTGYACHYCDMVNCIYQSEAARKETRQVLSLVHFFNHCSFNSPGLTVNSIFCWW